ncbi:restriction endonuclease subunit S [Candidatus Electronema halotolerans]
MGSEWRKVTWGDLATLEYGKGLRGYQDTIGNFRVFGTNGPIGWHNEPLCTFPSVIVGRKGAYRGIHFSPEPFFVIDTAFYLKPKEDFDIKWAYYELLTHDINSMDSGSAIPSTSRYSFYTLPVLLPSKDEQKAIAHILGSLDDRIDLNRRMNETLEAMAQALFKSWFVDFEPVIDNALASGKEVPKELAGRAAVRAELGDKRKPLPAEIRALFPDEFVYSDEMGWIPKGWRISEIGNEVDVVGGGTPSTTNQDFWENGNYHWTTPKDLSGKKDKVLLKTERKITEAGLKKISSGLLPVDTVLLSSRAPIGYLALAKVPVAVNQGYIAMKCNRNLPSVYILQWADSFMDDIKRRAGGTTFAEINKKNFRTITVLVPNEKSLNAYKNIVNGFYDSISESIAISFSLATIRDTLLPKLLSGELRIPDAEKLAAEAVLPSSSKILFR